MNIFIAIIQEAYNEARKKEVQDAVATELARIRKHEDQLRDLVDASDSDSGGDSDGLGNDTDADAVRVELEDVVSNDRLGRTRTWSNDDLHGAEGRLAGNSGTVLRETLSSLQSSQQEIASLSEGVRATQARLNDLSHILEQHIVQASAVQRRELIRLR